VSVLYAVPFPLRFPYVTKPVLVTKLRMEMETPGQVFSYRAFKSDTKRSMFVGLKDMIPKEVFRDVANLTSKSRVRPPPRLCPCRRQQSVVRGAGGDHGIDHDKNWLRFTYAFIFSRCGG
jgi:hypothetical protein